MSWGMRQIQNGFLNDYEYKRKMKAFRDRQNEMLKDRTKFTEPIPDMRKAMESVRKSNVSFNNDLLRSMGSRRV